MKRWWILLIAAVPTFWIGGELLLGILRTEFYKQRVGYGRPSGVTQWAWLGPYSPWPTWAMRPAGVKLHVQSNFEAAPGEFAAGVADVRVKGPARAQVEAYGQAAEARGWAVNYYRMDTIMPSIPPRPMRLCILDARLGERVLRYTVYDTGDRRINGMVYWSVGGAPTLHKIQPGRC